MGSGRLLQLIRTRMPDLSRPIQKSLTLVSAALLALCSGPRSANGKLSALARVLPSKGSEKSRAKRFWRFGVWERWLVACCRRLACAYLVRLVVRMTAGAPAVTLVRGGPICPPGKTGGGQA